MAYQETKEHKGKKYRGMKVGRTHRWTYADGTWREKKLDPAKWAFTYAAPKQRQSKAPKGSGAEEGSGYHWYITAHQWVRKVDANEYRTFMEGEKHLVGFQKPEWQKWNTQFRNQPSAREKIIGFLEETLHGLKADNETPEDPWDLPQWDNIAVKGKAHTDGEEKVLTALRREQTLEAEA